MKKRILAMLLAMSAMLTLLAVPASAEDDKPEFVIYLSNGNKLEPYYSDFKFMPPQGEKSIIIELTSGERIVNTQNDEELKPDEGTKNRYTVSANDCMQYGKILGGTNNSYKSLENQSESARNSESTIQLLSGKTDMYSEFKIYKGNKKRSIDISWRLNQPKVLDISAEGAERYTPVDNNGAVQNLVIDKDKECAVVHVKTSDDTRAANLLDEKLVPLDVKAEKENGGYKLALTGEPESVILELINGENNRSLIQFNTHKRLLDTPDKVVDYLCIGSQYTLGWATDGGYGTYPEETLIGQGLWNTCKSLGNFGGYITYYYEEPIKNDPKNPYGVDFIVYGNSNGGSDFSEPGNVLVSEDGENWYTLAGSEHYEDSTAWNYKVDYEMVENNTRAGEEILKYKYPASQSYPLYNWTERESRQITLGGTYIRQIFPAFGYADVRINASDSWGTGEKATLTSEAKNPYRAVTTIEKGLDAPENMTELYEGAGDSFDLDWAVDENGMPVELNEVHYIKVQTAIMIDGGFGEKSTEVNAVVRALPGNENVGKSAAPKSITVNGERIELKNGVYEYAVSKPVNKDFTVSIETENESNVYIGNLRASERRYTLCPQKEIIRIIVQEGVKEPLQYFVRLNAEAPENEYIARYIIDSEEVTRAEICAALYAVADKPPYFGAVIDEARGYKHNNEIPCEAVTWAVRAGILQGYSEGKANKWGELELENKLTRAELAVILQRYFEYMTFEKCAGYELKCSDAIPAWAQEAVAWAVEENIMSADENGKFNPNAAITAEDVTAAITNVLSLRAYP